MPRKQYVNDPSDALRAVDQAIAALTQLREMIASSAYFTQSFTVGQNFDMPFENLERGTLTVEFEWLYNWATGTPVRNLLNPHPPEAPP